MQTMHPVIVSGRQVLDRDLFPQDEFDARLQTLQASMKRAGWAGIVAYGNAEDSSLLTYLSNFAPRMRWALGFFPATGEPELIVAGPQRDLHYVRDVTWIKSIHPYEAVQSVLPTWIGLAVDDKRSNQIRFGLSGRQAIRSNVMSDLTSHLSGVELEPADEQIDLILEQKRPRELMALGRSAEIIRSAANRFVHERQSGKTSAAAAIAAEKEALQRGAHDARCLFSADGGQIMEPFSGRFTEFEGAAMAYLAVRYLGYWTETIVTTGGRDGLTQAVSRTLAAMLADLKEGTPVSRIADAARSAAAGFELHPFITSPVASMGLVLRDMKADNRVQRNGVYSLRSGLSDRKGGNAMASIMAIATPSGAQILGENEATALVGSAK